MRMMTVKMVYRLTILFFVVSLLLGCADSEYGEIRFQEFPEQYQHYDRMPWEMLELDFFSKAVC